MYAAACSGSQWDGVRPCSLPGWSDGAVDAPRRCRSRRSRPRAGAAPRATSSGVAGRADPKLPRASASTIARMIPSWMSPSGRGRPLVENLRIGLPGGRPPDVGRARSSRRRARAIPRAAPVPPYDVPAPCPLVSSLRPRLTAPSTQVRPAAERLVAVRERMRELERTQGELVTSIGGNGAATRPATCARPRTSWPGSRARPTPASSGWTSSVFGSRTRTSACSTSPRWHDDEEIELCWHLGEEAVAFWHRIGEGYAGRKPIDWGE